MIFILEHSILEHFLTVVKNFPSHSGFRFAWEKISKIVAMLVAKDFELQESFDEAGNFLGYSLVDKYSVVSVFPYGIRLTQSFLNLLPNSSVGYLGYSKKNGIFEESLCLLPEEIANSKVLICDAIIKTGETINHAISRLQLENVLDIKVVSIFSTTNGIENIRAEFPDIPIYVCSINSLEEIENLSFLENLLHYYNL
ncbi:MAG: uracil phosphoribosyltransferase [Candidatus Kapaibacteriota bacterium]|jgi:uracil phosphoribosyltransferase